MKTEQKLGHILAIFTLIIWGTTYTSTKILLSSFLPVEILTFRFIIGFLLLMLLYPRPFKWTSLKEERLFALAGFTGVCLYYLIENISLTYTYASNVGVIVAVAPFFTALLSQLFFKTEKKLQPKFVLGLVVDMLGICIISFNGVSLKLNPFGDFLALLAALTWALYSILTKKASALPYPIFQITRRIFLYGILFMLPVFFLSGGNFNPTLIFSTLNLSNLLFLGLCASGICFVTWNYAVKVLGAVKTSVYIYLTPVVTVATSVIILHEKMTLISVIGITLTLMGLLLSEKS